MHAVSAAIANSININVQIIKSMRRVSTASAQSINKQSTQRQQPTRIAPDFLMLGFSSPNTFTLCSMPLNSVILRGAEGEVAESILPESTLSQGVWRDRP